MPLPGGYLPDTNFAWAGLGQDESGGELHNSPVRTDNAS